jgi:hypothetical protein
LEDFSSRDGWYPSVFLFASWGLLEPCLLRLGNPDSNLATEIISADGVVLGKYFQKTDLN